MLIALTAYLLLHFGFGSSSMLGSFDALEKSVKHAVVDDARKKEALAIVEAMRAAEKSFLEKQKHSLAVLDHVLAIRTAGAPEIERAATPLVVEHKATRAELLHLRFELKAMLTPDEWAVVFPPVPPHAATSHGAPPRASAAKGP
jgi:hypothetical protein